MLYQLLKLPSLNKLERLLFWFCQNEGQIVGSFGLVKSFVPILCIGACLQFCLYLAFQSLFVNMDSGLTNLESHRSAGMDQHHSGAETDLMASDCHNGYNGRVSLTTEGISYNEEVVYSETEEDEAMAGEDSNGEEEEYYVEQLPDAITDSVNHCVNRVIKSELGAYQSQVGPAEASLEPPKKRRRRKTVPPEVKKDNHKERERARRNLIKDRFAYLRATIPTLGENALKMARTEVLEHVIEYIQYMRNRNQSHMIDIENLRVNNVNMEEQSKGLHMALRYHYKLGGYTEPNTGEVIIDGVLPGSGFTETMPGNAFNLELNHHPNADAGQDAPRAEFYHQGGPYEDINGAAPSHFSNFAPAPFCESSVVMEGNLNDAFGDESMPFDDQHQLSVGGHLLDDVSGDSSRAGSGHRPSNFAHSDVGTSHNIVIPTTVPAADRMSYGEFPSHHRCLDYEIGIDYESPDEEFIMLEELKADAVNEAKSSRKRQCEGKDKKPRQKRIKTETVDGEEAPKPRPRGRPRKNLDAAAAPAKFTSSPMIDKIVDSVIKQERDKKNDSDKVPKGSKESD